MSGSDEVLRFRLEAGTVCFVAIEGSVLGVTNGCCTEVEFNCRWWAGMPNLILYEFKSIPSCETLERMVFGGIIIMFVF